MHWEFNTPIEREFSTSSLELVSSPTDVLEVSVQRMGNVNAISLALTTQRCASK